MSDNYKLNRITIVCDPNPVVHIDDVIYCDNVNDLRSHILRNSNKQISVYLIANFSSDRELLNELQKTPQVAVIHTYGVSDSNLRHEYSKIDEQYPMDHKNFQVRLNQTINLVATAESLRANDQSLANQYYRLASQNLQKLSPNLFQNGEQNPISRNEQ
ncbi:unnamed protein product [Didymodactylos carnosus]|uniref:Uncharacterized protein n=1 Tax=Didymodactylos carnosus TaxID=1234261 RepID=A0A813PGH5_9BILA|nr:unnamed protein product [Didymodactylos carnosus]CAF3534995.1 unnamed protein product [Didymodactylos carnosus]